MSDTVEVGRDGYVRLYAVFQQPDSLAEAPSDCPVDGFKHLQGRYAHTGLLVQDARIRHADYGVRQFIEGDPGALVGTPVVRYRANYADPDGSEDEGVHEHRGSHCLGTIQYRDGYERSVTLSGKPVQHQGREAELFVITDLSSQSADNATSATPDMQEIGRIAKGIAHDLNNILQNILAPAELLTNEDFQSPEAAACIQQIIGSCKRGGGLIDRLLTFTRQDGPVFKRIHLQNVADTVRHNLTHSMPEDFSITTDIPDDIWPITASGEHMARVLSELSANAYEAEGSGGGVTISAENLRVRDDAHPEAPRTGAFVVITVSDEGDGMDDETRDHAFEPFFTTKGRSEHSGLGLPLIQDIITMHYGTIHCDSSPGEGTTFRIYIPAHPEQDEEPPEDTVEPAEATGGSIMIVDDDPNICWATQLLLERCGHTVSTASNGQEALDIYKKRGDSIDLIILDLVMPEMDGETCLNHLMDMNPDVAVIIASGSLSDQAKRRRLAEKAREYVSKPFESAELLQAVNEALEEV